MRDHLGGDKPLCPTIQGKLSIRLWTQRKYFSPILCCGRDGPSFLAKKYSMWCALIPISPSHPPAAKSGQTDCLNPNSTDVSAPGMCSLYNVEFLGIHPLYNTLQESPARHPSVWCTCSAESVSALEDLGVPKRCCSLKWQVVVRWEHRLNILK